jgi:hypothetical protein
MVTKKSAKKPTAQKAVKKKSKAHELNDFQKYALVADDYPKHPDHLSMDSTSVLEISRMANEKYSDERISDAFKIFNFENLQKLKEKNPNKYLKEGKRQILGLWQCIESMITHTALFNVALLIAIGKILNDIEDTFQKKSDYMEWLRDNFGHRHLRYFQHAKQLERMGDFARAYAALGKNRLLEFDRLKKNLKQSYRDILRRYPFEDITADHDGVLFKEHVDSIITFRRLIDAGIKDIEFDQAALIAAHSSGSITVAKAKSISDWLERMDDKVQALDDLILNKLASPYGGGTLDRRPVSLTKHIAELVKYSETADVEDATWIETQRDQVAEADIVKVHLFIIRLAEKLDIDLNNNENTPEIVSGERSES